MKELKTLGSLIELLVAVECGIDGKVSFIHKQNKLIIYDDNINIHESITIKGLSDYLGVIDYQFNGLRPEVSIGSINSYHERIGSYLMISTLLLNSAYNPINSRVQFTGFNEHRRGDVESMNREVTGWGVDRIFGGKPSQLLHLNYGFKFKFIDFSNDLVSKLFPSLDTLDSSADFVSNSNDEDSYLSKLITVFMSGWVCDNSLLIYDSMSSAYDSLIKLINESVNSVRGVKDYFLTNYQLIYDKALSSIRSFRFKLKQELRVGFDLFVSSFKKKLLSYLNPFDLITYESYVNNFMNSRGLRELRYLINVFNPAKATIPLPSPSKFGERFDLMVKYVNKYLD